MKLHHPLADIFPMLAEAELSALAVDIMNNGLRRPIVLFEDKVLDGRNRQAACARAKIRPVYETLGEGIDPLSFVISENLRRRHLTEAQRSMVAARLANIDHGGDRRSDQAANLPLVSQNEAAERLNVSSRSVRTAKAVQEKAAPEVVRAVDEGRLSVNAAAQIAELPKEEQLEVMKDERPDRAVKKVARSNKEKALGAKQCALPEKRFGVIYADPAWSFKTHSDNGMDRSADNHYPTMDTDAICALDVPGIAADDCILFLWATAPMLPDAIRVMSAWGFVYKSSAVWVKDRVGTGYWFRNNHELLLLGVRGDVPCPAMGDQWESVIDARVGAHSEKPEEAYELIESYFPSLPKIELNARQRRVGWAAWGNEL